VGRVEPVPGGVRLDRVPAYAARLAAHDGTPPLVVGEAAEPVPALAG
jgi:hypothetical protein